MKKVLLLFFLCFVAVMSCFGVTATAAPQQLISGCKAAYLCDWRSGEVVFAKDAEKHLPIASMCKIMTLLLCFEEFDRGLSPDEQICVSENASGMGGSQVFLETGGTYSVGDLLESICIASANDSCVAMAEHIAGSEDLFVDRMNARAKELEMNDTVFVNCTGLPASGQYSCAKDVAAMLSELMKHAEYFTYSRIWMDEIGHSGGRVTEMANTNKMIRSYQGCDAGKTGYTSEAGFCLAASALRGNMRVVAVVIGAESSKSRFENVKVLFDFAFANYTCKTVLEPTVLQGVTCKVKGGKKKEICIRPAEGCYVFCEKGDSDEIFYETEMRELRAPIRAGDEIGRIVVYKNNVEVCNVPLLANEDAAKNGYFDSVREIAQDWTI